MKSFYVTTRQTTIAVYRVEALSEDAARDAFYEDFDHQQIGDADIIEETILDVTPAE